MSDAMIYPSSAIERLQGAFDNHLLLADRDLVKVGVSAVVANKLQGDPFWLFLIGPPSSGKGEVLGSLMGLPFVRPLSMLTPQTFLSGMKGDDDKSLLTKLSNETILTFKDFGTVLTMRRESRNTILAQLREIYDGHLTAAWGTGKIVDWHGKLGFLAGVTEIIDTHYAVYQILGERFVQYRILPSDPLKVAKAAMRNQGKESTFRAEMKDEVRTFYSSLNLQQEIELPTHVEHQLAALSSYCAIARTVTVRSTGHGREIEYVPAPEAPPRLAKQLALFMKAATICGVSDPYALTRKVGFDSIHKVRFQILSILAQLQNDHLQTAGVASQLRIHKNSARRYLLDMEALGLLKVKTRQQTQMWRLSEHSIELLSECEALRWLRVQKRLRGASINPQDWKSE